MKIFMKKLFVFIAILSIGITVKAQDDTGTTPYSGTVHNYSVNAAYNAAASSNIFTWSVLNADLSPADAGVYAFLDIADGTTALTDVTDVEDLVGVAIQWNTAGTYVVQVEEQNNHCSTIRRINVTVTSNAFNVTIAANEAGACNSDDGKYIVDDNSNLATTTRTFLIKMTTDGTDAPTWKPEWKFNYNVTLANGGTSTVTFNNGTDVTGVVTVPAGTLTTTMTVEFDNVLGADQDVTAALTLISETEHDTADPDADIDNSATVSVWALPATTTIITD